MGDVLVVGAGPVGLTLACELARHGVRCRLIDRAISPSPYCRAIGVTPRTLEVWDDMGIVRAMIDAGLWITGMRSVVDGHQIQDTATPDLGLPYGHLGLPQYETERVLTEHALRFGVPVERGTSLVSLRQESDRVTVRLEHASGPAEETVSYVVGCDGAHSAVRHELGIAFEGGAYPWSFMLGDVHADWGLPYGMSLRALRLVEGGPPSMFVAIPLPQPGRYRVSMLAPPELVGARTGNGHGIQADLPGPALSDLQRVADDLVPEKPQLSDLRWSSIYRISMRLVSRYRSGRVFIAGDAAHIHPPTGGQGMNTGIQDAYNLAWKLALVIKGVSPPELLDSYEEERRPVGADVVSRTQKASESYGRERGGAPDRRGDAQVDISYRGTAWVDDGASGVEGGGLSAGDRAPDVLGLRQHGIGYPLRLVEVLRGTQHVLLVRGGPSVADEVTALKAWASSVEKRCGRLLQVVVVAEVVAFDQTPSIAVLSDPNGAFRKSYGEHLKAVLVRPDGHIGWCGPSWRDPGLHGHLRRLFQALS